MIICYLPPIKGTRKLHWCRLRFVLTAFLTILFSLVRRPKKIRRGGPGGGLVVCLTCGLGLPPKVWRVWFDQLQWISKKTLPKFTCLHSEKLPKGPNRKVWVFVFQWTTIFHGVKLLLNFGGVVYLSIAGLNIRSVCSLFFVQKPHQRSTPEAANELKYTAARHRFLLVGGFKHYLFSSLPGEDFHFD